MVSPARLDTKRVLLSGAVFVMVSQALSMQTRVMRSERSITMTGEASRRDSLKGIALGGVLPMFIEPKAASAAPTKRVLVAGATGQTGRRIVERLSKIDGVETVGGVRNVEKAAKALSENSIAIRGAMVQSVNSLNAPVELTRIDVVEDSPEALSAALSGKKFDALIIATGFVPGSPFKMKEAAHSVDNLGTIKLVDAAVAANIPKVVLVSSILTNGRNWGQENSPGFVVTNAFGGVLDEKIIAENYIRKTNLDYSIIRPGGLKAKPPAAGLLVSNEDTLNSGEVSRDLVADVCVASIFDPKASNKVVEIIENEDIPYSPLVPAAGQPPKVSFP